MPSLEEVLAYVKGLWLLILGKREGYGWLDISERGLWRSFAAILWSLPAMAVTWASWRLYYLSAMPSGTTVGGSFFLKLFIVDLASWLVPILLIVVLSRPLGFAGLVVPVIVTSNWLSVPLSYAMAVPAAVLLLTRGSQQVTEFLWLIVLFASIAVLFRLLRTITGNENLLAAALTGLFLLPSMMVGQYLQHLFGLLPG
ncbi:hypothetical protein [Ensifer sp. LCM 4579]|uniref:hypothetical protein n=1 Tax=Ensifer sp. LCM 4579 TaxID=1848292 RepID=UPI0008D9B33C|nr:hypothetical protein [Ensifer sp. LCM 4579]OHV73211.1 hypothetical protein LCM4579_09730 [Ensifer sp. LCM 4579]